MSPKLFKNLIRFTAVFTLSITVANAQEIDSIEQIVLRKQVGKLQINKGKITIPTIKNYQVDLIGSDNKVVLGLDGAIHQPLVSKYVNLLFQVTRKKDKAQIEIPVKDLFVQGKYNDAGKGEIPFVIPSLREWHGAGGDFVFAKQTRIVTEGSSSNHLTEVAKLLQQDLKKMIGENIAIVSGGIPTKGDIFLTMSKEKSLGKEGYTLKIDDIFEISAAEYTGSVFGTRTLLQLLAQNIEKRTIPKGESRDYPTYEVRGFVLDVGRKFFSLDFLSKYVEFMSYYKMSNFHIHLNDNAFHKYFGYDWAKTPSGFRLENDTYPGLTSKDGSYTKAEFIALQQKALRYGITIIPELDVPAHSLAIVNAVPEIGSSKYGRDHLDLSNPKTVGVVKNIFEEYISGPNPVFIGKEVHIGTDEYDKSESELFRKFTDDLIKIVQAKGKSVRAWGALTHAQGKTPVTVKDVTLNMWYNGYADPIEMKKLGYKQISTPDGFLYIVPAAGYYYDYLNTDYLYNNWEPRNVGKVTFEKGDPTIVGGSFALWNDIAGNGISEYDAHNRVFPAMQTLAEKMWTASDVNPSLFEFKDKKKILNEAPGLNMRAVYSSNSTLLLNYSFENSLKNDGSLSISEASSSRVSYTVGKSGQSLFFDNSESYFKSEIPAIGDNYTVSFWINPERKLSGELFKSEDAVISASENGISYTRDGYTYELGDLIIPSAWSYVTITGDQKGSQFYVNGILQKNMDPETIVLPYKDPQGKEIKYTKVKTLKFPLEKISLPYSKFDTFKVYNTKMTAQEVLSDFKHQDAR